VPPNKSIQFDVRPDQGTTVRLRKEFPGTKSAGAVRRYPLRARVLAFLAVLLAAASCGRDRDPVKPQPAIGDEILFSSTRYGLAEIYSVNADGIGLHRLTNDSLDDREPRWSPDGTKVVFIRRYDAGYTGSGITVMNADGSNQLRLTHDYEDSSPSWSPDGTQIAYQKSTDGRAFDLWVMNADGTSPHLLVSADSLEGAHEITWTSQNTFLGCNTFGILRFNADGTGRAQVLALTNLGHGYPRLSPDSSKIAFTWGGGYTGESQIYTVNSDGTDIQQITTSQQHYFPVWSPDGTKFAYIGEDFRIWTMNADGTNKVQVPMSSPYPGGDLLGDWH
jgi:hypothetical protein